MSQNHVVWDIPTRIFHWSVVVCVALAWWSGEEGNFEVHEWAGYTLVVLVLTRIVWGFVGSRHSRFGDFLAGPRHVLAYLRGAGSSTPGHNPLGGWSVMALLSLLLIQGVSGLFNSDDILFDGPLHYLGGDFSDTMGEIHEIAFNLLLAFVALHIAAIAYYQVFRRDQLVRVMLLGKADGKSGREAPRSAWLALVIFAVIAAAFWFGLEQAPQPTSYW
ncbi:hydrogenase [Mangrovimicrobium sediminis]|uniref:Hydrogenase n=1 Tax=Mangrovimicrobium sediminis TaxID=2562682 RepID=A0A4Z0M5Y0_9GAMM|nr:cytochrome b/b6 domain-containing protein [Haliea sp. SAOS-164]TGD74715.1 hydrogenase [Haliea sp. SAOS-164]